MVSGDAGNGGHGAALLGMRTPASSVHQVLGDGNLHVIEVLRRGGALWKHAPFAHRYPVDWRTKKPIIQARAACAAWASVVGSVINGRQAIIRRPTNDRNSCKKITYAFSTTYTRSVIGQRIRRRLFAFSYLSVSHTLYIFTSFLIDWTAILPSPSAARVRAVVLPPRWPRRAGATCAGQGDTRARAGRRAGIRSRRSNWSRRDADADAGQSAVTENRDSIIRETNHSVSISKQSKHVGSRNQ